MIFFTSFLVDIVLHLPFFLSQFIRSILRYLFLVEIHSAFGFIKESLETFYFYTTSFWRFSCNLIIKLQKSCRRKKKASAVATKQRRKAMQDSLLLFLISSFLIFETLRFLFFMRQFFLLKHCILPAFSHSILWSLKICGLDKSVANCSPCSFAFTYALATRDILSNLISVHPSFLLLCR